MLVGKEVTVTAQSLGVHRLPWPVMCDELSPPVTTILANPPTRQPANPPTACHPAHASRISKGQKASLGRLRGCHWRRRKAGLVNQTPLADAGNILGHPCVTISPPISRGGLFVSQPSPVSVTARSPAYPPYPGIASPTPRAWARRSSSAPSTNSGLSVRRSTARSMKRRTRAGWAARLP
jgi:hypothetical protein